jgi:glycoside/pentoside/hexuronide:cation symporter, GPH family
MLRFRQLRRKEATLSTVNPTAPATTAPAAAPMAQGSDEAPLPVRIKAMWATGAFGVAILMNGISALAMFYFVSVLGVPPATAGFLLFLSKLYDAVSDPLTGWLSDRTDSAAGRRRPWLFWGAIVSAVSFVAVFTVPFEGPGFATSAYILVALIVYTSGYSMFNVPYMAMPAEMTHGYHERSAIHGWRVMFASVGGFLSQSMAGYVLEVMGKDWDAHAAVGALGGALILAAMLTAWAGTKGAPSYPRTDKPLPIREQLLGFLRNVPFQQILAIKLVQLIGVSASSGGLMFFLVKVVDMPLTKLPLIGGPMVLAVLTCTPLLVKLSKLIGKRTAYVLSALLTGLVGMSWVYALPGEPDLLLVIRIAFAGNVVFAMSMLTDAMELDYHRTGQRREGMYSALYSFVEKLAAAVGPLVLGLALAGAGFDPKTPPSQVTEEVRQAVLLSIAYIPAAMALLAIFILSFYRLDEDALRKLREAERQ